MCIGNNPIVHYYIFMCGLNGWIPFTENVYICNKTRGANILCHLLNCRCCWKATNWCQKCTLQSYVPNVGTFVETHLGDFPTSPVWSSLASCSLFHANSLHWLPAFSSSETNPQSQILKMVATVPNAHFSHPTEYRLAKCTAYISQWCVNEIAPCIHQVKSGQSVLYCMYRITHKPVIFYKDNPRQSGVIRPFLIINITLLVFYSQMISVCVCVFKNNVKIYYIKTPQTESALVAVALL